MDTPILIFAIFGFILWLDNKRRNNRIKKMWDNIRTSKPIIPTRTSNASEYVIKRRNLRGTVEHKLSALGYDITMNNGYLPDNTTVDEVLSSVLGKYNIVDNPTPDEILNQVLLALEKIPVDDKPKNTEIIPQDTIDTIVDKLIADTNEVEVPPVNTEDAEVVLKKFGYKPVQIKKTLNIILSTSDNPPTTEEIVKRALVILSN